MHAPTRIYLPPIDELNAPMTSLRSSIIPSLSLLLPALFSSAMAVMLCIAFAAIIFSGDLAIYLPKGIAIVLGGSAFVGVVAGLIGGFRRVVFQPDDDTAPIYAVMVMSIVLALPATMLAGEKLAVVIIAIAAATILSGIALSLLGTLKVGSIIEYLPYSVMGGYFAAAGWLLVLGGFRVLTQLPLQSVSEVSGLLSNHWVALCASLAIAATLFLFRNRIAASFLLPLVTFLSIGLFYGISFSFGHSVESLAEQGWLIGPFIDVKAQLFEPLPFNTLGSFSWATLLPGVGSMAVIVLLSVMSLLLTTSGLALLEREDFEVNRELRVAGFTNVVNGLMGGMAAFPSLSLTALASEMGAPKTRALSLLVAFICVLTFLFGIEYIGYLPRIVIAGLLLNLGFGFLYTWLVESKSQYSLQEYLVIPIILLVASIFGFLQGVLIGLLAAIILFVVKYSQINVIRFEGDGSKFRSNVERSEAERGVLQTHSSEMLMLGLQGYLFFGTAGSIYTHIKSQLSLSDNKVRYVVLDFDQVTGIDASAGLNFERLSQLVTLHNVHLLIAGLQDSLKAPLTSTGFDVANTAYLHFMRDFDFALEWCEECLLEGETREVDNASFLIDLHDQDPASYERFIAYLEVLNVTPGQQLTGQGDDSDELFLLDDTSASAYIIDELGNRLRVRRTGAGTVYGEIGFFLGTPRTASIVADKAGRVYVLSKSALESMQKKDPDLVAQFQQYMLRMSVERLFLTTQTLKTVLR